MATGPIRPVPSDAAILEARRRSSETVVRLLHSWDDEGDLQEQRETLAYLKRVLDEDRPSSRRLFPEGNESDSHPPGRRSPRPDHQPGD